MKERISRSSLAFWILPALFLLPPAGTAAPAGFQPMGKRGPDFLRSREDWFNKPRRQGVPAGTTAAALRLKALRQVRSMPKVRPASLPPLSPLPAALTAFGSWTFVGPMPLNPGALPLSGRGTCVAVDLANDPTGNTIYYGSAYGGVWKSTNALGASPAFTPISDQTQSLAVGAIALDGSVNPPVIYVGTGESNTSYDSYYGVGLLKSTDGGNTWTLVSGADNGAHPFLGLSFCRILVDPGNPQVLVAGLRTGTAINSVNGLNAAPNQGIYRSTDGGNTWSQVPDLAGQAVGDVAYDATRGAYVAAVDGMGYARSTDQGQTWTVLPSPFAGGAAVDSGNFGRSTLAIRSGVIYGLMQAGTTLSAPSAQDTGLVESGDGGNTWSPIAAPPGGLVELDNQLWYNQYIGAPPGSTALVVAGNYPYLAATVNGTGTSWTRIATNLHEDEHAIGFAGPTDWFTVNDGGIWSTTDSGTDWTDMNATLGTIQFSSVSPDSQVPGSFAGGSQDNGSELTTASEQPAWTQEVGADGFFTLADPLHAGQYIGESQDGNLFLFGSQGVTGIAGLNGPFSTPLELIPQVPVSMLAGPNDVWIGPVDPASYGAGWHSISPAFNAHYLGPAPSDPDVIYVSEGSVIQKTANATSASPAWNAISPPDGGNALGHVAVSPSDPNTVYAIVEGFVSGQKILKSSDGGSTWTNISGNLPNAPMNWIAVDPLAPVSVYVASDVGVFLAPDGGAAGETWQNVGTGLPDTAVLQVRISGTNPRQLVATTHGRGAWTLDIGGVVPTFTPTVTPTPTTCGITSADLQLMEFTSCGSSQGSETFEVINEGTTSVNLSDLSIKFWVDDTSGQAVTGSVNYGGCYGANCIAVSGVAASAANFSPACGPDPTHQANWEITVSNTSTAALGAGVTWANLQIQTHLANWSGFSPGTADWYSPCGVGNGSTYTNDLHYALYYRGSLVTASGGAPPSCRPSCPGSATPVISATPTSTASPTFTPTRAAGTSTSTPTRTPTLTPTATPTSTPTPSPTRTPTFTPTGAVGTATSTPTRTRTSTPTATPSRITTLTPTFTPTFTASRTATPTPSPTWTLTPTATSGTGCGTSSSTLQLLEFTSCGSNQGNETFEVINRGASAVTLSDLTVKFWIDDTTGQGLVGAVNYGGCYGPNCTAVSGASISALNFSPACGPDGSHQADWEVTVSNTSPALLGAGVTWANLQTAIHLANWSNFNNSSNWYSPCGVGSGTTYANDLHYALYLKGNLVTASGGAPPSCRPLPTCTPGGGAALAALVTGEGTPTPSNLEGTPAPGFSVVAAPNVSRGGEPIQFRVELANPARLTLTLFALTGEEIDQTSAEGNAGTNTLAWNLKNQEGDPVASGLYFYRLEARDTGGNFVRTGKVAVLR